MVKELVAESKKNTFTKSIMSVVVFLYFVGAVLGTLLVILAAIMNLKHDISIETSMFIAYAAYLGGPTATAIIFYAWKSKAENVIKISKSFEAEESLEVMDKLSRMGGN